jgi:uncharacterized protein HemX
MPELKETSASPDGDSEERRHAERRRGEQRRVERALRHGATGLLLGFAAAAIATVALWRVIALERALEHDRDAARLALKDLDAIRDQTALLAARTAGNVAALAALGSLPGEIHGLGERLGAIEARIDAPQRAVARVEAAYLVELAQQRLALERDVRGAIALYEAAAARLATLNDASLEDARAALARDLARLRAVPAPDVAAIGVRLAAASALVRELPMLGMIKNQFLAPGVMPSEGPGLARAWQRFSTALADLVSIRRVSDASIQLVSMEEIGIRRQHLETLLLAARLAALRGDAADYATNVGAARNWLGRFFDAHDARVRALDAELADLGARLVSPQLPELKDSLRLLRGTRR